MAHRRRAWCALLLFLTWISAACASSPSPVAPAAHDPRSSDPARRPGVAAATPASLATSPTAVAAATPPNATAMILTREHIPILCYHHVRDWQASDPVVDRPYIVPTAQFAAQIDFLDTHGYHTITPDQLVAYLTAGQSMPDKPVLLTFDDGNEDQWTDALPILQKHHFMATFFIMTVVLDKPFYLSRAQVHALDEMGMTIGAHTWDHHRVTDYTDADWVKQVTAPTRELGALVGHPILYFAYPYGLWNTAAVLHIQQAGFVAAFQLEAAPDQDAPLFTIPRVIGSGYWTPHRLEHALLTRF